METKKIYLEQLFDKIRSLAEEYETDTNEPDVVVIKEKDLGVFSEDLLQIAQAFVKNEIHNGEELEVEEEVTEEYYITDWFDDDLD